MEELGSTSLILAATSRAGTDLAWFAFDAIFNVAMIAEERIGDHSGVLSQSLGLESLDGSLNESLWLGGSSCRASSGKLDNSFEAHATSCSNTS